MPALNYCRVGRTTLWKGAPLRIALRTDPLVEAGDGSDVAHMQRVSMSLFPVSDADPKTSLRLRYRPMVAEREGMYLFEIPTMDLDGSFEVRFTIGEDEEYAVPEYVWVLDRPQYEKLARYRNEEVVLPSRPLRGAEEASEFVGLLVDEFLSVGAYSRDAGVFRGMVRSTPGGVPTRSFAAAPIERTTRAVLSELRDLTLFGARDFHFHYLLSEERFGFGASCNLLSPLTEGAARMINDRECGELHLLAAVGELAQLELDIEGVEAGSRQVRISAEHGIDEFPLADARPRPMRPVAVR